MTSAYFQQLKKIPLLTARQEIELSRVIQQGMAPDATPSQVKAGKRAKEKFIKANMRLVFKVASRYENSLYKLDYCDLVSHGTLGLIRAVEKFDAERGYKFSTYSYKWIQQSIQRGIMNEGRLIRLPTHVHEDMGKIRQLISQHQASGSQEKLTDQDISSALSIPLTRYRQMLRTWFDSASTDAFDLESVSEEAYDYAPDIESEEREQQKAFISLVIEQMPPKEKEVITARFGLNGRKPETLQAVADKLGFSRERIRQIQVSLTDKLRSLLT